MIFLKAGISKRAKILNESYRQWRKNRAQIGKINMQILSPLDEIEKINLLSLSDIKEDG
jgi:hypothetical protein